MSDNHCHCSLNTSSLYQTLDELDFERGIWYAAYNNDVSKKLLKQGVSPDTQDKAGYSALHYAARAGHDRVCRCLLSAGASVDAVTRAGQSKRLSSVPPPAGREAVVSLLLSHGANPVLRDADGKTALHRAVEHNHTNIVKILIKSHPQLKLVCDLKKKFPIDYALQNEENIKYE
ncbi:hypothetical protein L9F63_020978, partial [Diploptera punctata]